MFQRALSPLPGSGGNLASDILTVGTSKDYDITNGIIVVRYNQGNNNPASTCYVKNGTATIKNLATAYISYNSTTKIATVSTSDYPIIVETCII